VQVPLDWANGIGSDVAATNDGLVMRWQQVRTMKWRGIRGRKPAKCGRGSAVRSWRARKNIEGFEVSEDGKRSSTTRRRQASFRKFIARKLTATNYFTSSDREVESRPCERRTFAKSEVITGPDRIMKKSREFCITRELRSGKISDHHCITVALPAPTRTCGRKLAYPIQLFTIAARSSCGRTITAAMTRFEVGRSICCGNITTWNAGHQCGCGLFDREGMGDPERVGTMGWSNGSILSTSLLINYPDRYKWRAWRGRRGMDQRLGDVDFGESFDAYYFGNRRCRTRSCNKEVAGVKMAASRRRF